MKKLIPALFFALAASALGTAQAADYKIDPAHSDVGFTVRHLVSKVNGGFKDFDGTFSFDPKSPESAKVSATIKVASISTNNDKRDTHLRSPDFFDASKFPTMKFESKKVVADGENKYKMTGDLTMKGVTKPVTLDVDFGGVVNSPMGIRAGFSATGKLNRKDFGIVWNKALDSGGLMLGEDIALNLNVEAVQQGSAAAAK